MSDVTPTAANRTLPIRRPNAAYRQREYLTEAEVEAVDRRRQAAEPKP